MSLNMAIADTNFTFPSQSGQYRGKVRDVYTIGDDLLVSIATDRISAFDVVFPGPVPYKGQVLNQLAAYFLESTSDLAPNWVEEVPDPNVTMGKRCEPFKIELVIRGALVGHAWRAYSEGAREICGVSLPDGLQIYDFFEEPIITPSTKASAGHDEDISASQIVDQGLASEDEYEELCLLARKLFARGQEMAKERGLILADTKYEFGKHQGEIFVIDEIHTPDSSRYFYAESYESFLKDRNGAEPKHLSKEFVRQWLLDRGFSGQPGQEMPTMDDDFAMSISDRYIELYEQLTGEQFIRPDLSMDPLGRIEQNIILALEKRQ